MRRGQMALGAACLMVASLVSGSGSTWDPATGSQALPLVAEAPDAATAVLIARQQGSRVEVLGERTATRTVYADPMGGMTAELTAMPTRIKRGATWADINTTLERRADGTVAPKAAEGDLTLSGGGSKVPLMRLTKDGKALAWYWPGTLPEPALSGNEARYSEVLPGVDLVVMAEASGYRQHLVIKDAKAARNPALARIGFQLSATDVRVSVGENGMLRADDDTGQPVFTAPPPTMWDATRRTTKVGVEIAPERLTLAPDPGFLADPATVFPVIVDPDWATFSWSTWGTVLSGKDRTAYPRTSGAGPDVVQVGRCYESDGFCNGIGTARAYFQFDTQFLAGKDIMEATFDSSVMYSPNCDAVPQTHVLMKSFSVVNDTTTWFNQPHGIPGTGTPITAPKSHAPGCPAWGYAGFAAADKLNPGGPTTVVLQAANESDQDAWRKYSPLKDPNGDHIRLRVKYNRAPNVPTNPRTIPSIPAPCQWCAGQSYVGGPEIRFAATLSDPDPNDSLVANWRVAVGGNLRDAWSGSPQLNGVEHSTTPYPLPKELEGKVINWWVDNYDGIKSASVGGPRTFVVDRTIPKQPRVSAALYKEDNAWHGGIGVQDTFTLEPAIGDVDIDRYEYSWDDQPTTTVTATGRLSGPAAVRLAPPGDGPRTLHVRSLDRAGNPSDLTHYRTYVRAGNGPYAHYSFEGNADDDAFLGDRDGVLQDGATYGPGAVGTALQLDGRQSVGMVARNAVRTDASFSVAAWVRPDELTATVMGVGSQDSLATDGSSGWLLNLRGDGQLGPRWTFNIQSGDPAKVGFWYGPTAPQVPQQGKWTHLAGVFDRIAGTVQLYIDGVPAGEPHQLPADFIPAQAGGQLAIGRDQWRGGTGNAWHGAIDEFGIYDRVLSAVEVRALVSRDNVQAAHWQFEETTGTTAKNSVTGGEHGVLTGGATFIDEGAVGRAVHFGDGGGQVLTDGPAMNTDKSFSVAAYVRADQFVQAGAMTAVSQDGNRNSGFYLQYNKQVNQWVFTRMSTDDDAPAWYGAQGPATKTPVADRWVHLAGVFDARTKQMQLFVDGEPGASITLDKPLWNAGGPVAIGRAMLRGSPVDFWQGSVDEVRMYSRVLTVEEIKGIIAQNNVTAGAWKLDGNATDSSSRALGGTAENGAVWGAGQTGMPDSADLALQLDGTDDYARARNAVNTAESFSVAAWARPDKPGSWSVVASQDGSVGAGFSITATGDGRWALFVAANDQNDPTGTWAIGGSVQYGVWSHVTGVYSKARKRIELYVNGVLVAESPHVGGPNTTGEFQIGRAKWKGTHTNYFAGAIDDVVVYTRPVFAEEVRTMAGRDLTLVHNWALDEGAGTKTADSIGGRGATLSGGAGYTAGKLGNAVMLDGSDDSVSTDRVDLPTDRSFTVSSWIRLDTADCPSGECRKDAVSIDGGGAFSKIRLGHIQNSGSAPNGKWIFEMPEPDGTVTEAAVTRMPGEVGAWVFLTGVYDAPNRKIWLYVNANRIDDGTLQTAWKSTGGLRIGRGTVNGAPAAFWDGSVDDVRLYTASLDRDRITALYRSYPAAAAAPNLPVADAGHWRFDENTGPVAADISGRGRTATLRAGAGWNGGRIGTSTWLNGTGAYLDTDGPVLATNQSFSVTGWATLQKTTGGNHVVLAQDRTQVSSFMVMFDEATGKWAAAAPATDTTSPNTQLVRSATPAVADTWTHLGVVYDATLHQMRLYVNGVLSGVQTGVTIMDSTGKFSIGRVRWGSGNDSFFPGGIDDVRAFGRALSDGEVRKVHDNALALIQGKWTYEGTPGDVSGRNNPATLAGGTSYVTGQSGQAVRFDGTSGTAVTQRPSVITSDSFTISAWVRLERTDQDATVMGQDGVHRSGFILQYNKNVGRWVFGAPVQDADGADLAYAYSAQAPQPNTWTHLTGVYDHAGRQFRLYVNGVLTGVRSSVQVGPAGGPLTMGRGKLNGGPTQFFPGAIDEVQTDIGIPADADIRTRAGLPAQAGN